MERRTASEFDQELLNLFDQYVHGDIDRRGFLERVAKFAVGGMTAAMLLDVLNPRFAEAQQVARDDKRLRIQWLDFESPHGTGKVRAYLTRPEAVTAKLPGVLVVHENRGLNPHIEDIARRLAFDNFVVLAPDALTPLGGYPGDEDKAREAFAKLDQQKAREDFVVAAGVLKGRPECTGKIGVVGFCYGGSIANMLATRVPDLGAAVPFYGTQRLARLRDRAEGGQRGVHDVQVPRHAARLQQRHHAAVRPGRRRARVAADRRLPQQEPAGVGLGPAQIRGREEEGRRGSAPIRSAGLRAAAARGIGAPCRW